MASCSLFIVVMSAVLLHDGVALGGFVCKSNIRRMQVGGVNVTIGADIARMHNTYRLKLAQGRVEGQPRAANMQRLYFDKQLAELAKKAIQNCNKKDFSITDSRWYHVGENVYVEYTNSTSRKQNWEMAIAAWFGEHAAYRFQTRKARYDSALRTYSHYTQLMWAESRNVGCDFGMFYEVNRELRGKPYIKVYTCYYGPGGNVPGVSPYQIGTPTQCSDLC